MHEVTLEYAIRYADQGLRVFPVGPDKSPLVSAGFYAGTTNHAQIYAMWAGRSVPMIGIVHDRFMVLDFDGPTGWKTYHEYGYRFPDPLAKVQTRSGGLHMYYPNPASKLRRHIKYLPNMDVLMGDRGYIIVPPSTGYTFLSGSIEDTMRSING